MTAEEEFAYLKGQIDALSKLCSFLIATNVISDNFTNMFKSLVSKVQSQAEQSANAQSYVKGFASLVSEIEAAREIVHSAGLLASLDQNKQH